VDTITVTVADPSVPVRDVANTLRVSTRTVWRLLAAGHLDRVKAGRATRVPTSSVRAFIANGGTR